MTKEDFKCFLIQKHIEATGRFPNDEERKDIQELANFAFNGE